jgi:hypothetical protein
MSLEMFFFTFSFLIYNICADDETVPTLKAAPELCSEAFIVK